MKASFEEKYIFVRAVEGGLDPRRAVQVKLEENSIHIVGPEAPARRLAHMIATGKVKHDDRIIEPPEDPSPELVEEINHKTAFYELLYGDENIEVVEIILQIVKD